MKQNVRPEAICMKASVVFDAAGCKTRAMCAETSVVVNRAGCKKKSAANRNVGETGNVEIRKEAEIE